MIQGAMRSTLEMMLTLPHIYERSVMEKKTKFFHMWYLPKEPTSEVVHREWESISEVILFSGAEYAYERTCGEPEELEKTVDACNQYGIPVTFLTATYTYNRNLLDWSQDRYKNATIIDWPSYWLACMGSMINHHHEVNSKLGNDITDPNTGLDGNIEYLFLSLTNQPKLHRCITMDLLAKYDLVDKGAIAWRDVLRQLEDTRTEITFESIQYGVYDWKYWTPKKMTLTEGDTFESSFLDWWIMPPHYSKSFMQIVPECSYEVFLISEKAAVPLLFNKLFLAAGPKDYHANVKDMGFKLYDELFDYSFDSEDDMVLRYEGLVQNVNRYRDKTPAELAQLIESVRDKLTYNRQHALNLARTMPPRWQELVEEHKEQEFLTIDVVNRLPKV